MSALTKTRNLPLFASLALGSVALLIRFFLVDNYQAREEHFIEVEKKIKLSLEQVEKEARMVKNNLAKAPDLEFSTLNIDQPQSYYIFKNAQLIFWSDYRYVPTYDEVTGNYQYKYLSLPNGDYLSRREVYASDTADFEIYVLLPVYQRTKINNKYLNQGYNPNLLIESDFMVKEVSQADEDDKIISFNDHPLFALALETQFLNSRLQQPAFGLQVLLLVLFSFSILLFFIGLKKEVDYLMRQKRIGEGFALLVLSLVLIRILMLTFDFPNVVRPLALFNGRYYASSVVNPSLGDLFLNALICLIIAWYVFRNYHYSRLHRKIIFAPTPVRLIISCLVVVLSFLTLYFLFYSLRTLYFNSQLTLDITKSIDFSAFKIISLLIIAISSATCFLVLHVLFRLFNSLTTQLYVYISFGTGLLITIILYGFTHIPLPFIIIINTLYFVMLYLLKLPKNLTRITYVTFLYLFLGALMCALTGAMATYYNEQIATTGDKQKFANQILIDNDVLGEFLLAEAADKIKQDAFILNRFMINFSSKDIIKEKVKRFYLSSYFDKYDVAVYLFNSNGNSISNDIKIPDYQTLKQEVSQERFKTADYSDIYFINQPSVLNTVGEGMKRYLCFIEMKRNRVTRGYIVIDLTLKRFFPNSVYPELLIDRRYANAYPGNDFQYAIFKNGELMYSSGNEQVIRKLQKNYDFPKTTINDEEMLIDQHHYLIVKGQGDEDIAIISEAYSIKDIISNFSFLFVVLVFLILLLLGAYTIYFTFAGNTLNFSTKIQLYLNAAFFMPLLAVSITTLSVISTTYRVEVTDQYLERAERIGGNVVEPLNSYQKGDIEEENLSSELFKIAKFAESDVNLFDTDGKLIASSQPIIYDNYLLSRFINPKALANIKEQGNNRMVLDESVGNLHYKDSYIGIKSFSTGRLIGILSIPFFESQTELETQIITVLTNVINIFTIIFIIFLIVSYLASNILTFPLKYITQKLKRTSLADYNEPLSWNSDDEIGLMIGEYNRMLVKLESSKEALSRSEKESAWREMAKQVAHEIKNPLTPMKLSLQHLKRVLENEGVRGSNGELIIRPIDNLLDQVDTLNEIATSFSSFAQMPVPKSEYFDLAPVVRRTVELFQDDQQSISLKIERGVFGVVSDRQLMNRIISNLLINAKQSIPQNRRAAIQVNLQRGVRGFLIVKISDNGTGIAKEIQDKIFLPNFSTKYSGSGIGLAIAKRGIEHAGGRITFETKEDFGTTFYIELPLAYNV